MKEDEGLDRISAMFAEESAALRKRTLWLSLIPIVIGAAVVITAYYGVADARARRDALLAELEELFAKRDQLEEEFEQQKALAQHLTKKLPAEERNAAELVQTGLDAYNEKNYEAAVERLEDAVARDPSMAEAHYRLGLSLWRTGRKDEALANVQTAFKLDPSYEERARRDRRFKELWNYSYVVEGEKSASNATEATAIKEAITKADSGEFDQAVTSYDEALKVNPKNAKVHSWKGYALYREGEYEQAIASFKRCIDADPTIAECHYNLGLALWETGDRKGTRAAFEKTWELDPAFKARARQDPAFRKIIVQLDPKQAGSAERGG